MNSNKKYYLRNPEIINPYRKYLNAVFIDGQIADVVFLHRLLPKSSEFSKADLETIKNLFPKTFSICEVVEVKEES